MPLACFVFNFTLTFTASSSPFFTFGGNLFWNFKRSVCATGMNTVFLKVYGNFTEALQMPRNGHKSLFQANLGPPSSSIVSGGRPSLMPPRAWNLRSKFTEPMMVVLPKGKRHPAALFHQTRKAVPQETG